MSAFHHVQRCATPPGHPPDSHTSTDRKEYARCLGFSRSSGSGSACWVDRVFNHVGGCLRLSIDLAPTRKRTEVSRSGVVDVAAHSFSRF